MPSLGTCSGDYDWEFAQGDVSRYGLGVAGVGLSQGVGSGVCDPPPFFEVHMLRLETGDLNMRWDAQGTEWSEMFGF